MHARQFRRAPLSARAIAFNLFTIARVVQDLSVRNTEFLVAEAC